MTPHEAQQILARKKARRQKTARILARILVWIGVAVLYYAGFSLLFDTPREKQMRHSTDMLREQYRLLEARYDSLAMVLENLNERDRNVFNILFESNPYNPEAEAESERLEYRTKLLSKSNKQLLDELSRRTDAIERKMTELDQTHEQLALEIELKGDAVNYIPAIQPVINNRLSLLTAGYGTLMHPFYRTLKSHQGVDYTIPEGSSVFATADGTVREVTGRNSTLGQSIVIDHGNGYQTHYNHLSQSKVSKGQRVKRGDIIALSGNSGLSLSPHLHYEVRINGMRVNPVHYFFMELSPSEYQRIIRISQSGMQSFD